VPPESARIDLPIFELRRARKRRIPSASDYVIRIPGWQAKPETGLHLRGVRRARRVREEFQLQSLKRAERVRRGFAFLKAIIEVQQFPQAYSDDLFDVSDSFGKFFQAYFHEASFGEHSPDPLFFGFFVARAIGMEIGIRSAHSFEPRYF
jgi:hypothetical protein